MKKLFFLFLFLSSFLGQAQYTPIPDSNFENALILLGIDSGMIDGQVLTNNINTITSLDVTNSNITDLTGIDAFTNLETLNCAFNSLTTLDLGGNIHLKILNCTFNKITNLDVSKNIDLDRLSCFENQLSNLNISTNINLTYLDCSDNNLTSLDLKNNLLLVDLFCLSNNITSLDLSKNINLEDVWCQSNKLKFLDASKNTKLTRFYCFNNELVYLNLKNGNNFAINNLSARFFNNPNLECIQVDNVAYSNAVWTAKDAITSYSTGCPNVPPIVTASGNQIYCPQTSQKIATAFDIIDPDDTATDAIYIQISSGYVNGQDVLTLINPSLHPTIQTVWDVAAGKLTLSSATPGTLVSYLDFIAAVKDVEFNNLSATPSGTRNFSINLGQANYLPSTGHYYQYVPNVGVSWTNAKAAAEASTYYGLKGYLATLLSLDEAKLAGEQASGAGWIGGSDAETEGTWKWVTGPEAGTIFWNGVGNGSTPNFAYWNTQNREPNQDGEEDYAHITAPGVGILGSWNDLSNTGYATGNFQPKGYIVEFGGMPGDAILQISASTTISIPRITSRTPSTRCGSGSVTLQATADAGGIVSWYDRPSGGTLLHTGNSFSTPTITITTTYYAATGCGLTRTPITATIDEIPTIISTNSGISRCGSGTLALTANVTIGTINWYDVPAGGNVLNTGTSFVTPILDSDKTYYVEAFNTGCSNGIRTAVNALIYDFPIATDQEVIKCKSQSISLDAGVSGMNYLWSTGETSQVITVANSDIYTVTITSPSPENCSSTKTITVTENNIPEIDRIEINETTVTIHLKQQELYYEYSVDGIYYQSSNVFYNVPGGLQTAYVREVNFCSSDELDFVVLITPSFFTPNNDSYNDVWEIKGLFSYPNAQISIFDRYGKWVTTLNINKPSWDGTFNNYPLPSDDYWYIMTVEGTEKRGHFSLKR